LGFGRRFAAIKPFSLLESTSNLLVEKEPGGNLMGQNNHSTNRFSTLSLIVAGTLSGILLIAGIILLVNELLRPPVDLAADTIVLHPPATRTPTPARPTPTSLPAPTPTIEAPISTAASEPTPEFSLPTLAPLPVPTATPQPTPRPLPGIIPARIRIPAISVDTNVQQVGLDSKRRLGVPTNYTDVAWFKGGYRPGERGNAVIDGHVDSPWAAAIFYNLKKLQLGDRVYLRDNQGHEKVFEVYATAIYLYDQAPLDELIGPSDEPQLNLITCTGIYDQATDNYDRRFVVYTRLVDSGS
jgi:LPXTG-site transpeptidase (sortase) family protein